MRIAVYAISKNEVGFVPRFMASAADADVVLIADTGSTDGTAELAEKLGAVVPRIHVSPWRFDKARDTALALLPADVDVCISLDLDEVLEPGWREEIERVWTVGTTRLRYGFDWGANIVFQYEKIHARNGYHWHHPVHEYPRPDGRITEVYAQTDKLLVRHLPDNTKSRGQYMPLLDLAVQEDPRCPRNAFYRARELTFYKRWPEAIAALTAYLAMPEATWPNERCYAMRLLGEAHWATGRRVDAMAWWQRAAAEAPNTREPWVALALAHHTLAQWPQCYAAACAALAITDRQKVYTCDPEVWGAKPHDLAAISAYRMGLYDAAIKHGEEAARLAPDDERLKGNLTWYRRTPEQRRTA
jgi:hypothetical protein